MSLFWELRSKLEQSLNRQINCVETTELLSIVEKATNGMASQTICRDDKF